MEMKKGNFKEDEDFFYFDVEASNENLDLEQQSVLQRALLESQDYFLTNGVVSKDHLHKRIEKGQQITDEQYVIGEPVSVYTNGKSTRVKGRLYKRNKHAQKFIELLRAGSTRIKASVGGIIPKVVKNLKDGTEKVISVLWNDLALTIAPVNYTVSPASGIMVKSLTSLEFVKSLTIGYETDSSKFTGGRALQKEDVEHSTVDASNPDYEGAIAGLVIALSAGEVKNLEEAKGFLKDFGISTAVSLDVIREIASKHKEFAEVLPMAKKSGSGGNLFAGLIENIRKSMGGGAMRKGGKGDDDDPENQDVGGDDDGEEEEEEELIDAEEVIKALTDKVEELEEGQEKILKALESLTENSAQDAEFRKSIGEGMIALMENYGEIAKQPLPRRGIGGLDALGLKKGNADGGQAAAKHRQFTVQDRDELIPILTKAVKEEELDIHECGRLETQINKSIRDPNFQIDQKFVSFLKGKLKREE
jgi:uncharacterized protein (DUF2344 family)